jgi:hypothetical protein
MFSSDDVRLTGWKDIISTIDAYNNTLIP